MTYPVLLEGPGVVPVTVDDIGAGQPFLLLHGGAGPLSVAAFAAQLAAEGPADALFPAEAAVGPADALFPAEAAVSPARVLTPTHPGFNGRPRPAGLDHIADLARLYAQLVDDLDLTGVTVIGNSIGGWIAAELALLGSPRISRLVLVDAVGLSLDAHPIVDFFALSMDEIAEYSYANPAAYRIDVDSLPPAQKEMMASNRATLATYGGTTMADPGLLDRLPGITIPTLVVWGAADRIVPAEHGRAYAEAIPGARWELIADAGHLPQLETPDQLVRMVREFTGVANHA